MKQENKPNKSHIFDDTVHESKAYATSSLVLGITGLVLWMMPYFGIVLSILAIIFSRKQKELSRSTAGLVLGIIGTCINSILLIFLALTALVISVLN